MFSDSLSSAFPLAHLEVNVKKTEREIERHKDYYYDVVTALHAYLMHIKAFSFPTLRSQIQSGVCEVVP